MSAIRPEAWRVAVERIPVSVLIVHAPTDDPEDLYLVFSNPAAPIRAEARSAHDRGRLLDVFPGGPVDEAVDAILRACLEGEGTTLPEFTYGDARVPEASFLLTIAPLPGRMAALYSENLTAQRRAEAELRLANEDLEAQVRARTASLERTNTRLRRFASIAAHDLSSPLMRVLNFLDLVEIEVAGLSENGRDLIGRAQSAALQLKARVDVLLEQATNIGAALHPVACAVEVVADTAIDKLDPLIKARGARISRPVALPAVLADPSALESILINLIKNAIVHNPGEAPLVELNGRQADAAVEISVCDSAPPIPGLAQEKIFRLFHRLDPATPGSGIGLAMSRELAEALGGTLRLDACETTGGNRFTLTLPAGEASC